MKKALQYAPTPGLPDLLEWLRKLQQHYHRPANFTNRYDLCITTGSMEGLGKVFELLLNPNDPVLVDSPCFSGTLDFLRGFGADVRGIDTDSHGMSARHLEDTLSNWSNKTAMPKALYTIPNGSNPTGVSMTLERKKEIYNIAQKYNLLIIEDDPYYFLQFKDLVPSFLSLDVEDGRVIRLDSMSKILSAGMRIGFVTAPTMLLQKIVFHQQVTSMHASTISQMIALKLLEKWNLSGFQEHIDQVRQFYEKQKTMMVQAIKLHLKDMVKFNEPDCGMFIWMEVIGIKDTRKLIFEKAVREEVLLLPGSPFFYDLSKPCSFVRVSYSLASPEQTSEGMIRFGKLLRNEIENEKTNVLQ